MAEDTRLPGHSLLWKGGPHHGDGGRIVYGYYGGVGGTGRAKCSCGAMSPVLASAYKRRAWHREHKHALRPLSGNPIAG